jgi:hypothetical protein
MLVTLIFYLIFLERREKNEDTTGLNFFDLAIENGNTISVYDRLSKYIQGFYIKGKLWNRELRNLDFYDVCEGKFGTIHIQNIRSENQYRGYINKFGELLTLI